MLVHLSSTSPYVCDLSLGPIEQANRMASAPARKLLAFLELKESFPKATRTPLKLLAPDEVPMDTSVATTTEMNTSRQQSLQPVWYTEQTIVDDVDEQQRSSMKSPGHRHDLTRSTLPTIQSDSPDIEDEIVEKASLMNHPSLMRKSSTFTIEQQPSIDIPSPLNESEKENDSNVIITSTQEDTNDPARHPAEPSDESFRALEHLLGLGSTNANLTMTTTTHESPKSNHDTLSLTIVTPTELINNTTATSLHLSYAPAGGGSLPSSQNILLMPTIESITEPSMNSSLPPPFLVDNSDLEEPSSTGGTDTSHDTPNERSNLTEEGSFRFTDEDEEDMPDAPKDDTNNDDENNFSFELNDFTSDTKEASTVSEASSEEVTPSPPPMITIRAPTSADVAFRALVKRRAGGRTLQPMKIESPLAKTDQIPLTVRTSVPIPSPTRRSRVLRSSSRQIPTATPSEEMDHQAEINEPQPEDAPPHAELIEVMSVPEDEESEDQPAVGITLNLTTTKEVDPSSPSSADRSASSSGESPPADIVTPSEPMMTSVLSREYTYDTPTRRTTRSSHRRHSSITTRLSSIRPADTTIPPIEERSPMVTEDEKEISSDNISLSPNASTAKTLLSVLSTNPTSISEAPPIILRKSLAGSASPSPNPTPTMSIRQSERLSSNLSPRRSINPLHSSTPSIRNRSVQMVSIGEQEQVSTTVPPQLKIDSSIEEERMSINDNEQQVDIPIEIHHATNEGVQTSPERPILRMEIGVQTTPSLNPSAHRRYHTIEQQTTPVVARSSSSSGCQTVAVPIPIQRPTAQQTSPPTPELERKQESTPVHSKAMMHLRRNVRFQFTPSTDARLAAKEKQEEEEQRCPKPPVPVAHPTIEPIPIIVSDNEREEDTEDEVKKKPKTKKKTGSAKKKKAPSTVKDDGSSEETHDTPTTRRKPAKETAIEEPVDTHVTSSTTSTKKRSARQEKKASPVPESPVLEPEAMVVTDSSPPPPPAPTKRANRKRPNPKTSIVSPPETISPPEQPVKRVKTSKSNDIKPPPPPMRGKSPCESLPIVLLVPSPEAPTTRSRVKAPAVVKTQGRSTSSPESPVINVSKKVKKISSEPSPVESVPVPTNNKRKSGASTLKKGKRRLHSVEQDEGLNTADEEEAALPAIETSSSVHELNLSHDDREKVAIEALTVAELKARLTAHGENIPRGARKADLVTQLIHIEIQLLKERKEIEAVVVPPPPSRKTRRKK